MDTTEKLTVTSEDASMPAVDPADKSPPRRVGRGEVLVAVVAFAALCVAVLVRCAQLLEPDDYAYRASIVH